MQPTTKLFINGEFVESKSDRWVKNYNPATNEVLSLVPCATQDEMNSAVDAAKRAFPGWKSRSILSRQQVMFKLRELIKNHMVLKPFVCCMF